MKIKRPTLNAIRFKQILKEMGIPAIKMARDLKWSHTKLNWFVKGYYSPSDRDRQKIIGYLSNYNTDDLFITPMESQDNV